MFSSAYSRRDIISFFQISIEEIKYLLARFHPGEYSDTFIIKLKMVAHLAEQAFGLSLKVSYLDEASEYHKLVDILDDIYLQIADYRMRSKAGSYGFLVSAEFEAMIDKLGLVDERLKTMKIVCKHPRSRNYVKHHKEGHCWVDKNGFRMRTPIKVLSQEEKEEEEEEEEEEESAEDRFERNQRLIKRYSKRSSLFAPSHEAYYPSHNDTHTHIVAELSAEQKALEEKNKEFIHQAKIHIKQLENLQNMNPLSTDDRIRLQCNKITELYNYLLLHTEFVATKNTYRNYSNRADSKKHSFMQIVIKKCVQLAQQITDKYNELRSMKLRANPDLRKAKVDALATLEKVKQAYSEYYVKHPYENEPLADLLSI